MCFRALLETMMRNLLPPRDRELNPLVNHPSETLYGLNYAAQANLENSDGAVSEREL
jgi:hypothetical protein